MEPIIILTISSLTGAIALLFLMHISIQINKIEALLEEVVYSNKNNNQEKSEK